MSTYGVVCEDGSWIATKYNVTHYFHTASEMVSIPAETINGKKSKIWRAGCDLD
ncbi:hypothetical protein CAEBREN_25404 [Caenorhabditis brenneri]|uniref:Uncharacterized protein n=1 Tax=Caenorhabditis brenneri TaxID=135651 RepID=G0NQC0_CAEBE|nr:hypothetical protein CAEBREN_25404 [Caenorhabditis brenneri]